MGGTTTQGHKELKGMLPAGYHADTKIAERSPINTSETTPACSTAPQSSAAARRAMAPAVSRSFLFQNTRTWTPQNLEELKIVKRSLSAKDLVEDEYLLHVREEDAG